MDNREYVLFKIDQGNYALDIKYVENIERTSDITSVPFTEGFIEGVINLRGEIIPVINVRKRLGIEDKEFDKNSRIIILKYNEYNIGLLVDESYEVLQISEESIEKAPNKSDEEDYIEFIGKDNGRIIMILDIFKFLKINEMIE